ncbi:MAG TPA: FHA domain-containing protein [Gemmatimonadaceae bacterium]
MGPTELLIIVGVPAVVLLAALCFGVVLPRLKRARQQEMGITLAAFSDASMTAPPRPTRHTVVEQAPVAPPMRAEPIDSPYAPPRREAATGTLGTAWPEPVAPPEPPRLRLETTAERPTSAAEKPRRSKSPMDGTLQFLQGRFEVIEGREIGQEIRFVRQPGSTQAEVTFGRQDGTPYRHVQLHEPTVSRLHAKMTLEDKDWRLTNLSATNPASVNGKPLDPDHGSVVLRDGDRVEMGEVVFRFRAK